MNTTLMILAAVGTIGAIDVFYYHLYRFRLFAQPGSAAEEVTHLLRGAIFVAILLVCLQPADETWARVAFFLFAADMGNSVVDVLLERKSREPLGGLPSGEYLVHILSTFGTGLAVASYTMALGSPAPVLEGLLLWQVWGMIGLGIVLVSAEALLFARALSGRSVPWAVAASARS
ncbi:MAG: hypothetical protein ABR538_02830 [Candidatus Binatia bacterium]